MSGHLPSYLHTLRLQWGLSQPELADLLSISPSLLSKVESLDRRPTAHVILGASVVFGLQGREIFPTAFREIEDEVIERARAIIHDLEQRGDASHKDKIAHLKAVISRAEKSHAQL